MDGKNWELLINKTNLRYTNQANTVEQAIENIQSFDLPESKKVQYVKIVADRASNGNWFTARAFNFYQDVTNIVVPTASIAYSTTDNTNEPVKARLVNPSTEITITNNDGKDTYIFTENGEFIFEFVDSKGQKGAVTAKVTWIDKKAPTADVDYSLSDDKKLIAILDNISEDVYLLDKDNKKTNFVEVENGKVISVSYLDEKENEYKVVELDENKITKKITYTNTLQKPSENVAKVRYYVTSFEENGEIQRKAYDEDGQVIELTNNELNELKTLETVRSNPLEFYLENNEEYEFKLLDMSSNIAYKNIKVDYIDNSTKILASDITYDITSITNKNVVATINPYVIDMNGNRSNGKVIDEDGNITSNTHLFTKNGKYDFRYTEVDKDDKVKSVTETHTARVSWIDIIAPTAQIRYSTQNATNEPVTATLVNESEEIIITNNGASNIYTFTKNGKFTFKFQDKAGNEGTVTAVVDWIGGNPNKHRLGDINGDSKITSTDLLLLKRHIVADDRKEWILTGEKFTAGDINKDGAITATDLIQLKRLVLKELEEQ